MTSTIFLLLFPSNKTKIHLYVQHVLAIHLSSGASQHSKQCRPVVRTNTLHDRHSNNIHKSRFQLKYTQCHKKLEVIQQKYQLCIV
jgi:hypothetical protein